MPRIRTIKPGFWSDYALARDLTRDQRLFYIALWNEADDEGRLLAHPRRLLGVIFPYEEDLTEVWVRDSLRALSEAGKLVLYDVEGEPYAEIVNFSAHQKINRPTPSAIPPSDSDLASIHGGFSEPSVSPHRGKGKERKGKETTFSKSDEPISDMWEVWVELLGGRPPIPRLTPKRKDLLRIFYREHLAGAEDPVAEFRAVLKAVKRSEHHMSKRAYQMPESLFRNEERRDLWMVSAKNGGEAKSRVGLDALSRRLS